MSKTYKYFNEDNIPSLSDVLDNRENRIYHINSLEERFKGNTVLCFKLNIPGPQKNNDVIQQIFNIGVEDIRANLVNSLVSEEIKNDFTGPEYFLVTDTDPIATKKMMVDLEENAYFGRLYDIDVVANGESINRETLNYGERKCFLCDNPAKVCARNRTHTVDEMIGYIEEMIINYKGGEDAKSKIS